MAHAVTTNRSFLSDAIERVGAAFRVFGESFALAAEAQAQGDSRLSRVRALQAKSDAELAQMGLRREEIVHQVFRNHSYL